MLMLIFGRISGNSRLLNFFFLLREIGNYRFAFHRVLMDAPTCERGDSNPHGLLHWILSPARLPIPPLPRSLKYSLRFIVEPVRSKKPVELSLHGFSFGEGLPETICQPEC